MSHKGVWGVKVGYNFAQTCDICLSFVDTCPLLTPLQMNYRGQPRYEVCFWRRREPPRSGSSCPWSPLKDDYYSQIMCLQQNRTEYKRDQMSSCWVPYCHLTLISSPVFHSLILSLLTISLSPACPHMHHPPERAPLDLAGTSVAWLQSSPETCHCCL